MVSLVRTGKVAAILLGWAAVILPGFAQSVLFVEHCGKMRPVIAASDTLAVIMEAGKRVSVRSDKFAMAKVEEFSPVFVAVHDVRARDSYVQLSGLQVHRPIRICLYLEGCFRRLGI
jgi:hypothetical protein